MAEFLSLLKRVYLAVYNWTVFFGWIQVLVLTLKTLMESGHEHVYSAVEKPLQLAQTAAVMEIIHGLVGLVRSPVTATVPQISGRLYALWGVLWSFPEIQTHVLVSSLVLSWSITEVIRYSFFGCKETFGFTPSWLLWLRYSTFLVLNPSGLFSEAGLLYSALPYAKESDKYQIKIGDSLEFTINSFYAAIVALVVLIPGGAHMFMYMLTQRKKALSKKKTAKKSV